MCTQTVICACRYTGCISGDQIRNCDPDYYLTSHLQLIQVTCYLFRSPVDYLHSISFNRWVMEKDDLGQLDQAARGMVFIYMICAVRCPAVNLMQGMDYTVFLQGFPSHYSTDHVMHSLSCAALSVNLSSSWTARLSGCLIHVQSGHVHACCTKSGTFASAGLL